MEKKKPDDIMAECLLRGGKMLSKACRACGSPLFEVKGETLCVVCRETGKEAGKKGAQAAPADGGAKHRGGGGDADPAKELRVTIAELSRRARGESDPERCMALLEAAKRGAEALALLQR
ncbi:MAG: Sjogren's syndrome/scleroderma autoantigen 1 family protein [Methanomicrobiales archaeon]